MIVFFKGILIGFLISVPVGPIAVLCIQRALSGRKRHGFISGLGAATADSVYAALAVLGVSFISEFLLKHQRLLGICGAVALILLGIKTFFKPGQRRIAPNNFIAHAGNFFSTFILTLLNPITILAFIAIFSAYGLEACHNDQGVLLVVGVFAGTSLWWLTLSALAGALRQWVDDDHLTLINRIAGIIICLFALVVLYKTLTAP